MNRFAILVLVIAGIIGGVLLAISRGSDPGTSESAALSATVLPEPTLLPEFSLIDHEGKSRTRDLFHGKWNLLFFGFTHCPDICPTTLATLASVTSGLEQAGFNPVPGIVLVSVDPERDTPQVLASYIGHFGADSVALTGSEADVRRLTEPLYIYFQKVPLADGEYTVDHSSVVLLVNPDGEFHAMFSGPLSADVLVRELPVIIGAS